MRTEVDENAHRMGCLTPRREPWGMMQIGATVCNEMHSLDTSGFRWYRIGWNVEEGDGKAISDSAGTGLDRGWPDLTHLSGHHLQDAREGHRPRIISCDGGDGEDHPPASPAGRTLPGGGNHPRDRGREESGLAHLPFSFASSVTSAPPSSTGRATREPCRARGCCPAASGPSGSRPASRGT